MKKITMQNDNSFPQKSDLLKSVQIDCLNHISKAYNSLQMSNYIAKIDEVQITADLFSEATKIPDYFNFKYTISPERPDYVKEIREGKKSPKKARKYDVYFENWNSKNRISFGMEAKLLVEQNYQRKKSATLIKEYVSDAGMGKFINKIYEEPGCMLGYIMQGDMSKIIDKINYQIEQIYDSEQCITKSSNGRFHHKDIFISEHKGRLNYNFYHFMLNFQAPSEMNEKRF